MSTELAPELAEKLAVAANEPTKRAFDPDKLNEKLRATAGKSPYTWEVATLDKPGGHERLVFHKPAPKPNSPSILITTGIHGNEPSGPIASLDLLSSPALKDCEVVLIPMVNPVGLGQGKRGNGDSIDLNRDFALTSTQETRNLTEFYRSIGKFTAAISPHEDWEKYKGKNAEGAYIYEMNRDGGPVALEEIKTALEKSGMPRNRLANIDGLETNDGIIRRTGIQSEAPGTNGLVNFIEAKQAETSAIREVGVTDLAYIVETPSYMRLDKRVKAHVAVVEALANKLSDPTFRPATEARDFDLHTAVQPGKLSTIGLPRPLYGENNPGLYTLPLDIDRSKVKDILSPDQVATDRKNFNEFKAMARRSSEIGSQTPANQPVLSMR